MQHAGRGARIAGSHGQGDLEALLGRETVALVHGALAFRKQFVQPTAVAVAEGIQTLAVLQHQGVVLDAHVDAAATIGGLRIAGGLLAILGLGVSLGILRVFRVLCVLGDLILVRIGHRPFAAQLLLQLVICRTQLVLIGLRLILLILLLLLRCGVGFSSGFGFGSQTALLRKPIGADLSNDLVVGRLTPICRKRCNVALGGLARIAGGRRVHRVGRCRHAKWILIHGPNRIHPYQAVAQIISQPRSLVQAQSIHALHLAIAIALAPHAAQRAGGQHATLPLAILVPHHRRAARIGITLALDVQLRSGGVEQALAAIL